MKTLADLLAQEGFERVTQKTHSRGSTSGTSTSTSSNRRFRSSFPKVLPLGSHSDVNLQRSASQISEITDTWSSNGSGSGKEEQFLYVQEPKVLTSEKKYKYRGSSVKKQLDMKFMSRKLTESKNDCSEGMEGKCGYDRYHNNDLYAHDQTSVSQNLHVRPDGKNGGKDGCPVFSLDEIALKEIISMTSHCVDRLLKDESFRSTVLQECVSSLNACEVENKQVKAVLYTLKKTMMTVERMINEGPNQLEMKKASFMLSVITGLKKLESEDRYPCLPNSYLVGCAHLYLSILYKMQKKDKVSAKHLLQVFCDSPNQARTKLLPELWRYLFFTQLSHLKEWYDNETQSVHGTSQIMMKVEVLDRLYNDFLDGGTSLFAAYYKSWLMDDNRAPILLSLLVPLVSFLEIAFSTETVDILVSEEEEEMDAVECETERGQSDAWSRRYDDFRQKYEETYSHSPSSGLYAAESFHEYYSAYSEDLGATFEENNQRGDRSRESGNSSIVGMKDIRAESEMVQTWHNVNGFIHVGKGEQQENDNKPKKKKPSQVAVQIQAISESDDKNTYYPMQSLLYDSHPNEMTGLAHTKSLKDESDTTPKYLQESCSSAALYGCHDNIDQASFTGIPEVFLCPLTGLLFKEPVTLESGYTFELAAIKKRVDQGIATCPITGQSLKYSPIPETNFVFKQLINEWIAECFRYSPSTTVKSVCNSKNELGFSIFEQLLSGFSSEDKKANIKHLIALGGLQFLTQMFELGTLDDKSHAAEILVQCIQADGCYRTYLAMHIRKSSILELIHNGQIHEKINAASLLIELIRLNRRMDITTFLSGLKTEASGNLMSDLLICLKSSLPVERVLVAVLILHFDHMEESHICSSFSGEAVKIIISTLECCLSDHRFIPNCRAALLILGGHFSCSGEILTEVRLLKQAGFSGFSSGNNDEEDGTISEEEEIKREEWLRSIAVVLLRYKKKSFIETLSKCWKLGCPDLAKVCLVTTVWLSLALPSLPIPAIQFSVSSSLLPRLRDNLRSDMDIRQRVLACFCLLNLSKILDFKSSLKATLKEVQDPLRRLRNVTWTARDLYNNFFDETPS